MGSTCSEGGYWGQVACLLSQPSWLTNVGLSLALTMLSIALAYFLLRHQLAHGLRVRAADKQSALVREYGAEVIAEIDEIDATPGTADSWRRDWAGWSAIYRATRRLAVALGDPDVCEEIVSGARDLNWAWKTCVARWAAIEKLEGRAISNSDGALAMDSALMSLWNVIREAGEELVVWDGLSPLPSFVPWPKPHIPLPFTAARAERHHAWRNYYADSFEQHLLAQRERRLARQSR